MSRKRKLAALLIALSADLLQGVLFPLVVEGALSPVDWVVDVAAAVGLLCVVGFRTRLLLAFVAELVPGLALFPTWTAFALTLLVEDRWASRRAPPAPPLELEARGPSSASTAPRGGGSEEDPRRRPRG